MATLDDVKNLLRVRAGFEAVEVSMSKTQARLVGRVPPNAGAHWVVIVHYLLNIMESRQWKVDISRSYFNKQLPSGSRLFYAWRLLFQAADIEACLPDVLSTIDAAPQPSRVELTEFPLAGASASRNSDPGRTGRGAQAAGSAPLITQLKRV